MKTVNKKIKPVARHKPIASRSKTKPAKAARVVKSKSVIKAKRAAHRAAYPFHKRLLMHPFTIFAFLCVGVFMAGWTYQVVADTVITAVVAAPPLQTPATIDTPADNTISDTSSITVGGSCPSQSYVKLQINGSFSGVGLCSSNNRYSIRTSLYPGRNELTVNAYNVTDMQGPTSNGIKLTYTPPVTAAPASKIVTPTTTSDVPSKPYTAAEQNAAISPPSTGKPLLLTSDFQFHTFTQKTTFAWEMDLEGGSPPYNVHVNWGDGTASDLYFPTDPIFTLHHQFATSGYYAVVVSSIDNNGASHITQLAALITDTTGKAAFFGPPKTPGSGGTSTQHMSETDSIQSTTKWLLLAWPAYVVIVLMSASFLLGERREFILIGLRHKRHAH